MREVAKHARLAPEGCWFQSGFMHLHVGIDPAVTIRETRYVRLSIGGPVGNRIELMQRL